MDPDAQGRGGETIITDDQRLIEGFLRGDPQAIGVVNSWIDVVLREGFRSIAEDWEDLRQEVRFRVFRNLEQGRFDGRSALRTYVHRIARNVCIDSTRKAYRSRETGMADGTGIRPGDRSDAGLSAIVARDFLLKILRRLSGEDRLMIRLVFGEHLSYEEVAGRLGVSEGTVKSRMSRCKERILRYRRELLEKRGEGP